MSHTITFVSADLTARTATFNVDGTPVTRPIAQEITSDTLQDHLTSLAYGLYVEATDADASAEVGVIDESAVPTPSGIVFTDADATARQAEIDAAVEAAREAGEIT